MEETTIQAIPITPEEAFRRSQMIADLDRQIAETRGNINDYQICIDRLKSATLKELEEKAATNDPDKKLSNADKRKTAMEETLEANQTFQDWLISQEEQRNKLDDLVIEQAHQTRVWRTIRAFAHTSNGHGGEDIDG
jgi:hypothetical protein